MLMPYRSSWDHRIPKSTASIPGLQLKVALLPPFRNASSQTETRHSGQSVGLPTAPWANHVNRCYKRNWALLGLVLDSLTKWLWIKVTQWYHFYGDTLLVIVFPEIACTPFEGWCWDCVITLLVSTVCQYLQSLLWLYCALRFPTVPGPCRETPNHNRNTSICLLSFRQSQIKTAQLFVCSVAVSPVSGGHAPLSLFQYVVLFPCQKPKNRLTVKYISV